MHGLIVNQFRQYVVDRFGRDQWMGLVDKAGSDLPDGPVAMSRIYPDSEVIKLVATASETTGISLPALLEDFGAFLAPSLLRVYEPLIRPSWRTLDIVASTESMIHTVVRRQDPTARPPYLSATRVSASEVMLTYTSPRRLCDVAKGIVRGLSEHFRENVTVQEEQCMHRGASACVLRITKAQSQ
jgi:hypothetical protein